MLLKKGMKKQFLFLTLLHLTAISAILRADCYYKDDMGRAYAGYQGWDNFSRYLSNFLSEWIHTDSYLADISPLPQIIAVCLLSIAGVIAIYVITGQTEASIWSVIAVLPLGLSPYFLECISYKYDAPYMALSILASVAPFLFFKGKYKYYLFPAASMLGTLAMCTTYQAASGIFPMFVIFICIQRWNQADSLKEIGKFFMASVLSYGGGLVVFRLLIMKPVENYVSNSIPGIKELLPATSKHLMQYFTYVRTDFTRLWKILTLMLAASVVVCMVYQSARQKFAALLLAVCALGMMGLVSFGIYPILAEPLYAPRAMYGFGAFLAIMGVYASNVRGPSRLIAAALSWVFFVFAFTYGNALAVQDQYTDFRTANVIDELNRLETFSSDKVKTVQIAGSIGYSPVLAGVTERYGMLKRLIPITFGEGWVWATYKFYHYYGLKNVRMDVSKDLRACALPVLADTLYFTVKGNGDDILVELK